MFRSGIPDRTRNATTTGAQVDRYEAWLADHADDRS
jgi:hypothetical protein